MATDRSHVNIQNRINELSAHIDSCINTQINSILHTASFQQLESSWRGAWQLATQASASIPIRLLNITSRELHKDLTTVIDYDQTHLFKQIVSMEYDHPGGTPYGLIICDYYFSHKINNECIDSISLLTQLAKIGSAAFTPIISGLSAQFLGLDCFTQLNVSPDYHRLLQQTQYQRWQQLCHQQTSRYLGLTLPRTLMRVPYNQQTTLINQFFTETIQHHNDYLWGNACYYYATNILRCFQKTGWFIESKGYINKQLSGQYSPERREYVNTDGIALCAKTIAEYALTLPQEQALSDIGLLPLSDHPLPKQSIFYSCQSLYQPKNKGSKAQDTHYKISSMLHYILCAARMAHTIKIMMREKIGSFMNSKQCEYYLQQWLRGYCARATAQSPQTTAKYPLNDASIQVHEQDSIPGKYVCTINIKPHYPINTIDAHLQIITDFRKS
jgi:type VI secretion system protein ImpD